MKKKKKIIKGVAGKACSIDSDRGSAPTQCLWPADVHYIGEYRLKDAALPAACALTLLGRLDDGNKVGTSSTQAWTAQKIVAEGLGVFAPRAAQASAQEITACTASCRRRGVQIRMITDAAHPACGERGLFAARAFAQGALIVPYIGLVESEATNDVNSSYSLLLCEKSRVVVDATLAGNEARFVNDFRNTGAARPNAEFRTFHDEHHPLQLLRMGLFAAARILPGQEILVTYGKGYWQHRGLF